MKFKIDNCTYLRKERTLKVPKYIDELALCNYCAFQNSVDGKMEYFFILNKEYVTEIDVYASYYMCYRMLVNIGELKWDAFILNDVSSIIQKIKGNDVRLSINIWEIQQNRYFISSLYSL